MHICVILIKCHDTSNPLSNNWKIYIGTFYIKQAAGIYIDTVYIKLVASL